MNGRCAKYCSKFFGSTRYCGDGDSYTSGVNVDCTGPTPTGPGCDEILAQKHIRVADFEDVVRSYWVQAAPSPSKPAPLIVGFHGQSGDGKSFGQSHTFHALGKPHNLMAIFPQGMHDADAENDQGTGWNVGSYGPGNNATCVLEGVGSGYGCYNSCRKLKKCGRCNWSTCYDDVLFVTKMIQAVAQEFCIDLDRIYAHGESNGAMMVQHVAREMPDTFAGIDTWFGTPMVGFLLGSRLQLITQQAKFSQTAWLSLHGRNDTCIPPQGGETDGGWIFETLKDSTGIWAGLHHCDQKATPIVTRWDGGPLNFRCAEYKHCSTGRRVVQCMYDGVHGDWPTGTDGDEINLWFLLQFSRDSTPVVPDETIKIV